MSDPTNVFAMDDIKFMTGYNVDPVVASEIAIEEAINRFYGSARSLTSCGRRGDPPEPPVNAAAAVVAVASGRRRRSRK